MRHTKLVSALVALKPHAARAPVKLACLAILALAGCKSDYDETVPPCPEPYLLPDAASFTRFGPRGTDLTDLLLSGRMLDIKGGCGGKIGGKHITAHAHVEMVLTRGPAAKDTTFDIPYSVGIVRAGGIVETRDYVEHVSFPSNVSTVQVTGQEVNFDFPTPKGVSGTSYHVYFYFKLSPGELARNRATGGRE